MNRSDEQISARLRTEAERAAKAKRKHERREAAELDAKIAARATRQASRHIPSFDDAETFPPNAGTAVPGGPRVRIPVTKMKRS